MISRAWIIRLLKNYGLVSKRTKKEILDQVKSLTNDYGAEAERIIVALLWSLGYSQKQAEEVTDKLIKPF